jgi:iron complex outermembrane receptor protein
MFETLRGRLDLPARRYLPVAVAAAALLAAAPAAIAADADSGSASSQEEKADYGTRANELVVTGKAPVAENAPSKASLAATEPQSIITHDVIDQFTPQTADFTQVVLLTPSVSGISFNGPGLYEAKTTLRGFPDGQYSITYDGIPFGDTNDPTHHSTTFFPASTIGAVVVDRGPGAAGQLGQANFGGSINLFSPEVPHTRGIQETLTYGSWDTWQSVTKLYSGDVDKLNGSHLLLNFAELGTNGYLSFSDAHAYNQMGRAVIPIAGDWALTLYATYNYTRVHQDDNNGATLAQVAQFGKNFALNNDPTTMQFKDFNLVKKKTNFDYAKVSGSIWPKTMVENTVYTYYYSNHTLSALDVTGATPVGTTKAGAPAGNKDIPGYTKLNYYHVYGDILRVNQELPFGELRLGGWVETSRTHRSRYDYDLTTGAPDLREKAKAGATAPANIVYDQHSSWEQFEPFADFVWKPISNLTITPGIKYFHFKRNVSGPFNQGTRNGNTSTDTIAKPLYFATVNYQLRDNWSVYGQFATGLLEPPLSVLQTASPNTTHLQPQTSTNYQAGTVYHGGRFSVDADVYYIDFNNKVQSQVCPIGGTVNGLSCSPGETVWFNLGGAVYKGFEGEITVSVTDGLFVFGNGSYNKATVKGTGFQIGSAPVATAAFGALVKWRGLEGSIADKWVGEQWAAEGEPAAYRIPPYNNLDLTLTYKFNRHYRFEAGVYNLLDSQKVTKIGVNGAPFDQYYYQPERNFQISIRASF